MTSTAGTAASSPPGSGRLAGRPRRGLIAGAVAIYLCIVGIVPVFGDRPLIDDVISLGQAFLVITGTGGAATWPPSERPSGPVAGSRRRRAGRAHRRCLPGRPRPPRQPSSTCGPSCPTSRRTCSTSSPSRATRPSTASGSRPSVGAGAWASLGAILRGAAAPGCAASSSPTWWRSSIVGLFAGLRADADAHRPARERGAHALRVGGPHARRRARSRSSSTTAAYLALGRLRRPTAHPRDAASGSASVACIPLSVVVLLLSPLAAAGHGRLRGPGRGAHRALHPHGPGPQHHARPGRPARPRLRGLLRGRRLHGGAADLERAVRPGGPLVLVRGALRRSSRPWPSASSWACPSWASAATTWPSPRWASARSSPSWPDPTC